MLVPVGGRQGLGRRDRARAPLRAASCALFSIGDAAPILRTARWRGCRTCWPGASLDPQLRALNDAGALNGHVPVTAIVTRAALLTAPLHGFDAVAMANERSASAGNLSWDGVEVNHQFSKSLRVERLLSARASRSSGRP